MLRHIMFLNLFLFASNVFGDSATLADLVTFGVAGCTAVAAGSGALIHSKNMEEEFEAIRKRITLHVPFEEKGFSLADLENIQRRIKPGDEVMS